MKKFFDILEKLVEWVSVILLLICVASSLIQVVSRTLLNNPLLWCEEMARFSGVWMIMWAMGLIFKARGHIEVDFFYSHTPKAMQKYLDIINDVITIVLMVCFTCFAVQLMMNGAGTKSPSLRLPMSVIYSGVVAGAGISVLFAIYATVNHTKEIFFQKHAPEREVEK